MLQATLRHWLKCMRGQHRTAHRWPALSRGDQAPRPSVPFVNFLNDADLAVLNGLLDWKAFTLDEHGRRLGKIAWPGKRDTAQAIPDRRILLLNERFPLANRSVTEVGCFEGIHTIGLLQFTPHVTSVDARIENVVKTIVRTAFYGCRPTVFTCDLEQDPPYAALEADVVHHNGVLYHLKDPVGHLLDLGRWARTCVMLDTHYATDADANLRYEAAGRTIRYKHFPEGGRQEMFSGMYDHAKWLRLDDLIGLLREAGFAHVDVAETRQERNGPRVLLFASR